MKREKLREQKETTTFLSKLVVFHGWGIGIRTPTNRVRVCRATVTQFPKICNKVIIPQISEKSTIISKKL